jgi:hypothetical protein
MEARIMRTPELPQGQSHETTQQKTLLFLREKAGIRDRDRMELSHKHPSRKGYP